MQKKKNWQTYLVTLVIILTIYNILPTIFYYAHPLKSPISQPKAEKIALNITQRVNELEEDSVQWLKSYCKTLKIRPTSIDLNTNNPQQIFVQFNNEKDADKLRKFLPRAGNLINFVPAQLNISALESDSNKVIVQRQIPLHFNKDQVKNYFSFASKLSNNELTDLSKEVLFDRAAQITLSIAGPSEFAMMVENVIKEPNSPASKDIVFYLAHNILDFTSVFGENSTIANRFFASFTQNYFKDKNNAIQTLLSSFDYFRDQIKLEKSKIKEEDASLKEQNKFLSDEQRQTLALLEKKEQTLINARNILKTNSKKFASGKDPFNYNATISMLNSGYKTDSSSIALDVQNNNTFIDKIILDWKSDKISLILHKDVVKFKEELPLKPKDSFEQLLINELAKINRLSDEKLSNMGNEFVISLTDLTNSNSILSLNLSELAQILAKQVKQTLFTQWIPKHTELVKENFPIYDYETYLKLPAQEKDLCLVVYAPNETSSAALAGMKNSSIYVIAKGLDKIIQKYENHQDSNLAKQFFVDFNKLQTLLRQNGYLGYSGKILPSTSEFSNDYIFEMGNYYNTLLKATRENFQVKGTKKFAILEFTNLEQRILTLNKIETRIQEDLLKWKDDYNSAQVSLEPNKQLEVPKPTKNVLLNNFALSFRKYFRGDERKIIHWGLDLSGGKTVQIELRDQNNKVVKDEASLKQGINELYNRVNKMGVSEVNIRTIDSNIVLDFPGSQGMSAAELVKASSMYFHVVNEKFTPSNSALADNVNRFLQEVWNEAIVTNRKDVESVNSIAWRHLYGDSPTSDVVQPRSESAKILYENGLRLASPYDTQTENTFNDSISKIAIFRGDDYTQWNNQTNPLLIVFNNYALEGSSLVNIRSSYDPSKGNFLSFEVKGSHNTKSGQKINSREDLYTWTAQFAKEKIVGTPLENFSKGRGWRMAVILNDSIISAPNLESALRDSAMITGNFSLREVNLLVADLKAGSLSYTPHILSEKNVSPELGKQERTYGIIATFTALILVMATMIIYYRFAGVVASVAVLFNLFIMWATLQNIQATLTLAGIAGIILTVGMAVDANVLVFERIKEEFAISGRIATAIQNGYKKAFSAILDSNITTIIAALILLHFDSGPIKGFAITLIIGIISSMFTALFMTKYYFMHWVKNPKHDQLKMSNFVKTKNFNFLKNSKYVFIISSLIILFGFFSLAKERHSIFGMDFTGGFSLSFEVEEQKGADYRQIIEKALTKYGALPNDFQIRELTPANNIRLLLGAAMDLDGKPFYNMPIETDKKDVPYQYENNPRIVWVVNALKEANINIKQRSLEQLNQNWTAMSGQMSDSMRNNSIVGLSLALFCILIYITLRFEFKFAISAMICLIHDVLISIGSIALLHLMGIPIQIDLNTVAALMTIIGYSLNDTIVIFDRIREDIKFMRKATFSEIVNHALNITLSRTTITSGTTLVALLALVFLGGSMIFNFAFVMTVGVIFGTLSSIFIASPLMLFFHKFTLTKEEKMLMKKD